jgi:hypothetical protein
MQGKPVIDVWGMLETAPDFRLSTLVPADPGERHN